MLRAALSPRPFATVCGLVALCSVVWLGAAALPGEPVPLGTRSVRVYSDAAGLPQNTVHTITLDQRGYLWVGTQDGAAYYDGQHWHTVDMPERTRSNFVRCILPTPDGSLWFGTQHGALYRLKDGVWSSETMGLAGGDRVRVNTLLATRGADGGTVLWAGTYTHGLVRLDRTGWTTFDTRSGLPHNRVWGLLETSGPGGATLWVGTQAGLACLRPGASRFTVVPSFPTDSVNSLCLLRDAAGVETLWAGTYGGGLARFSEGAWSRFTTRQGLPSDFVTSLVEDRLSADGPALWVGTDGGGAARIHDGSVEVLGHAQGLPSNAVYSLLQTRASEGARALWVGMRHGGLARIMEGQWQSVQPIPGRGALPVTGITELVRGDGVRELWFGTDGGGVVRAREGRWTVFDRASGVLPNDNVVCLYGSRHPDGTAVLWVGLRNGGLARFDGRKWSTLDRAGGALPNNLVQAVLETVDDTGARTLWVGTRGGLSRLHGGTWSTLTTADGLPHDSVLALLETRWAGGRRVLWVGTAAGVARLEAGRLRTYDATAGLLNTTSQCLHASETPDGQPELWIGTDGGGLYRLTEGLGGERWETFSDRTTPALPNNVVYQVVQDRQGRFYVLTNRGVTRLARAAPGGGGRPAWEVHPYTVEDGLPLNQCNRGAAFVDSLGRVWVGTAGGAGVLDPLGEIPDREPKRVVVRAFAYGGPGQPRALVSGQVLPWYARRLRFELDLLSYFREQDTRYRTQLVGLDAEASEWTEFRVRELARVPAGRYTLRVWGRDYAGNVAGPFELAFVIRPAPWVAWWAWVGYGVLAVLAVLGVLHLRTRAHRRREEELRAIMDARTRELRQANELLVELSYLDSLTGIGNRRRFEERLVTEWKRAVRSQSYLSLVMIDIDHFKPYNDAFGHQKGDECLRAVATALVDGLPRAGDSVARYGGEEFAVILPLTNRAGAVKVAESLRLRVEALALPHPASSVAPVVTISCGVATFVPTIDIHTEELIRLADEALYHAKQGGRNQTRAEHGPPRSSSSWPAIVPPS
ncbi:MAG TPA: diguanylate cyclase [Thermoanaerobaculaceae bacterium]|nr:diguanylate cyclase [Thermoanaerobaculaceae bacterium]HRS14849.1 diguanylate cyclase [Thermoanaerobaculaceae bacterium]